MPQDGPTQETGSTERDFTEATVASARIYQGAILALRKDQVRMPNGRLTVREVLEHSDSVCMVPLDADGCVLLVRQYRKPTESVPARGPRRRHRRGRDARSRRPCVSCRKRYPTLPGTLTCLWPGFWLAPGWCDEYMYTFLATDLRPSDLEQDFDEMVDDVSAFRCPRHAWN